MEHNLISLSILTPEKEFMMGEAVEIIFGTPEGRLGIMAGHAPIIASVSEGIMEIFTGEKWRIAAVGQGFAEIAYEKAEFYLDTAEWADEIDSFRAKEALYRAERRIQSNLTKLEYLRTQAAINRALARLKAAGSLPAGHANKRS